MFYKLCCYHLLSSDPGLRYPPTQRLRTESYQALQSQFHYQPAPPRRQPIPAALQSTTAVLQSTAAQSQSFLAVQQPHQASLPMFHSSRIDHIAIRRHPIQTHTRFHRLRFSRPMKVFFTLLEKIHHTVILSDYEGLVG